MLSRLTGSRPPPGPPKSLAQHVLHDETGRQAGRHAQNGAAHHQPDHAPAPRAERHTDTDLPRPPRHAVGRHRVEADGGQRDGDEGNRPDDVLRDATVPAGVTLRLPGGFQRHNRQIGIDAAHLFADERRERGGIAGSLNHERRPDGQ